MSYVQVVRSLLEGTLPAPPDDLIHRPLLHQHMWSLCQSCWLIDPLLRPTAIKIASEMHPVISPVSPKANHQAGSPNLGVGINYTHGANSWFI